MSKNICTINEFDDSIFFKAHCGCSSDNHIQTLELEKFSEDSISLHLYSKVYTKYWKYPFLKRLYFSWRVLWDGYIEYETEFLFEGKEQILDYIKALKSGMNKLV